MEYKIKNTIISIEKGDITNYSVEALVNAANNRLVMGGGVAGAIKKVGGEEIEEEAMKKGPIPVGGAVITSAGKLKASYVIHAAVMGMDFKTDAKKIKEATISTLRVSDNNKISSIAFPAFGTGVGRFPPEECAEIMLSTTFKYISEKETSLRKIIFVLYDKNTYQIFEKVSKTIWEERKR